MFEGVVNVLRRVPQRLPLHKAGVILRLKPGLQSRTHEFPGKSTTSRFLRRNWSEIDSVLTVGNLEQPVPTISPIALDNSKLITSGNPNFCVIAGQ
jgi:hypothetical protein